MKRLGKIEYEESIDEMKHAIVIKRILFLEVAYCRPRQAVVGED